MTEDSLQTAADAIAAILPDEGTEEAQQPQQQQEAEAPTVEEPTQKPAQEEEEEYETVEIDGSEYSVPKVLKSAILRHSDYTRKTQELAEQRKSWDSQKDAEIKAATERYQRENEFYKSLLAEHVVQPPDPKLLEDDPVEYLKKQRQFEDWRRAKDEQSAEVYRRQQAVLAQNQEQLLARRPEWSDGTVYAKEASEIKQYLKSEGVTDAEIANLTDHRFVLIADKARKYEQLMKQKGEVAKKIQKVPPKVERPGVSSGSDGGVSREAMSRLKKTGSVRDAEAAILSILG